MTSPLTLNILQTANVPQRTDVTVESILAALGTGGGSRVSTERSGGVLVQRNAREIPADRLVDAARDGAPGAFDAIVLAHQDRVFSFCSRMLGDRDEAADAAQEVFVSAWKNLSGFRGESALSTWLLRIASNRCLNRIRSRNARGSHEVRLAEDEDGDEMESLAPGLDSERPDHRTETVRTGAIIRKALARLDDETRNLILLGDIEGLSYEELSTASGLPLGTVKSRIHRARAALRKVLTPALSA